VIAREKDAMNLDDLFKHALTILPDAATDLQRAGRDPSDYVFASFDGGSELGIAFIASDLAGELDSDPMCARAEVERMIASAKGRGEELVVSVMVGKDVLGLLLAVSRVDRPTRAAMRLWLDGPLPNDHFRVVAIAGDQVRAAAVEESPQEPERAPLPMSMLN
jgi:hypothetical protein